MMNRGTIGRERTFMLVACLLFSGCAYRTIHLTASPVPVSELPMSSHNGDVQDIADDESQVYRVPRYRCRQERWYGGYYIAGASASLLGGLLMGLGFGEQNDDRTILVAAGSTWLAGGTLAWVIPLIIDLQHEPGEVFGCSTESPLVLRLPEP